MRQALGEGPSSGGKTAESAFAASLVLGILRNPHTRALGHCRPPRLLTGLASRPRGGSDMKLIGLKSEGDADEGSIIRYTSAKPKIARSKESPQQRGPQATGANLDGSPYELPDRSAEPSWPGRTYVIVVRKKNQLLYPVKWVLADSWEQAKSHAEGMELEAGARIEDVEGFAAPEGESVEDLREERKARGVG
jgi:hypothetical protein